MLLKQLKIWLNGTRDYFTGAGLFAASHKNKELAQLFLKGPTPFTISRLSTELIKLYNELKLKKQPLPSAPPPATLTKALQNVTTEKIEPANPELYKVAQLEATLQYKDVMNMRAKLFALSVPTVHVDQNHPQYVAARRQLAIDVVEGYNKAASMYGKAEHIKTTGQLPVTETVSETETDYSIIADNLVKNTLDNLRKNVSKIKKKPPTAERIAAMQKYENGIKILKQRWHLLKQTLQ